jgi:hypothetical protein
MMEQSFRNEIIFSLQLGGTKEETQQIRKRSISPSSGGGGGGGGRQWWWCSPSAAMSRLTKKRNVAQHDQKNIKRPQHEQVLIRPCHSGASGAVHPRALQRFGPRQQP